MYLQRISFELRILFYCASIIASIYTCYVGPTQCGEFHLLIYSCTESWVFVYMLVTRLRYGLSPQMIHILNQRDPSSALVGYVIHSYAGKFIYDANCEAK